MTDEFWKRKSLNEMSNEEWEALCDGCGLCCLQKLEDEETGQIYFTDVACKLLDLDSCRCTDYANRAARVKTCMVLSADDTAAFRWLPGTCAYRLVADGCDLPDWHPLVSGDPGSVRAAGISAHGKAVSESETAEWTVLRELAD